AGEHDREQEPGGVVAARLRAAPGHHRHDPVLSPNLLPSEQRRQVVHAPAAERVGPFDTTDLDGAVAVVAPDDLPAHRVRLWMAASSVNAALIPSSGSRA